MTKRKAIVRNAAGIHCRPSAVIVKEALEYEGKAWAASDAGKADLRSILDLVSLGLAEGARVEIRVSGPNEEEFCERLVDLFERHFDFPEVPDEERSSVVSTVLDGR